MPNEQNDLDPVGLRIPEFTFGDRLRKIRTDTNLDQREFAALIGLTSSTLAAYETGRGNPKFKDARPLAERVQDVTGVPVWWLLDYPESPLSDLNRRPSLYIVGGSEWDEMTWPDEEPKHKQAA